MHSKLFLVNILLKIKIQRNMPIILFKYSILKKIIIVLDIISRYILLYCKYFTKTEAILILLKLFQGYEDYTILTVLASCVISNKLYLDTLFKIISYVSSMILLLVNTFHTTVNNLLLCNINLITLKNFEMECIAMNKYYTQETEKRILGTIKTRVS